MHLEQQVYTSQENFTQMLFVMVETFRSSGGNQYCIDALNYKVTLFGVNWRDTINYSPFPSADGYI